MKYKRAETSDEIGKAFVLRYKVFVLEQGFGEDIEIDERDKVSTHMIALDGKRVVGTLRLFKEGSNIVLGRMAIDNSWRSKGIGRELVLKSIPEARKLGGAYLVAHSQRQALGFYEKCGFNQQGKEFLEEGVAHVEVRYKL